MLEYCDCLNQSEAYRRAGYEPNGANANASRLIANDSIRAAISEVGEQLGMSAGEAVLRMSRWASGSMEPFMNEAGELVLDSAEAIAARHTIKKIKQRKTVRTSLVQAAVIEEITTEIELYDAKDATDKILQLHARYKQLPGGGGTDNEPKGATLKAWSAAEIIAYEAWQKAQPQSTKSDEN